MDRGAVPRASIRWQMDAVLVMRASLYTGLAFVFSAVTPAFQGASLAGAADGPRPALVAGVPHS